MSDLDTSLRALRDELHAVIPVPDVERVAGRARTRRRLQIGAVAAVVAVALAVPVLRAMPSAPGPAAPPVPARTSYDLDFADADHGYALTSSCPEEAGNCSFTMWRTADGGRGWETVQLPPSPNLKSNYFSATMYVLGPEQIAIDRPGGVPGFWDRIYSRDGGQSWQVLDEWFNHDQVGPIPPGGLLSGLCTHQPAPSGGCDHLAAVLPDSGITRNLAAQPPLGLKWVGPAPTQSGKWWVTGRDRATGTWAISVSGDDGRSWSTTLLAVPGVPGFDGWAAVERDGIMYLMAFNSRLLGVWRSTDAGGTWTRTWGADPAEPAQSLPGVVGTPIATSDGTLVYSDSITTYVSTDLGRSFRRTGDEVTGTVTWTRAGYLRSDTGKYALSTDGVRWREFTVR